MGSGLEIPEIADYLFQLLQALVREIAKSFPQRIWDNYLDVWQSRMFDITRSKKMGVVTPVITPVAMDRGLVESPSPARAFAGPKR
jgi:hypothetical protein